MKNLILLGLFLLFSIAGQAQNRTIIGKVVDAETLDPIANATVIVYNTPNGTHTNYLGYFQIELSSEQDALVISHVSYATSHIQIGQNDKINIKINPATQELNDLFLQNYPSDHANTNNNNADKNISLEQNASYANGWEQFYTALGNRIVQDSSFDNSQIGCTLEFVITANGTIKDIQISPETTANKALILQALTAMEDWKPAIQLNKPIDQSFRMSIKNSPALAYTDPEIGANYPEGMQAFYTFVNQNLQYPKEARTKGIEGKVFIEFIVQKDGSLSNIKVVKGIGGGCDEEVIRIIESCPKWIPGLNNGKPVKQRIILPITFSISVAGRNEKISKATFKGGESKLNAFIAKNRKNIEEELPPNNSHDKVELYITIGKDGKVKNIQVHKSLGKSFDQEAVRLYTIMPKWNPKKVNGFAKESVITGKVYFGKVGPNKRNVAYNHYEKGKLFFENGKHEKAVEQFDKAIAIHPSRFEYYLHRAWAHSELGNQELACQDLKHIQAYDSEVKAIYESSCGQ